MRLALLFFVFFVSPDFAYSQDEDSPAFTRDFWQFQEAFERRLPSARLDDLINYGVDNRKYKMLAQELPKLCDSMLYYYHDTIAFLYAQPYLHGALLNYSGYKSYEPYKNKMLPMLKGVNDDITMDFVIAGNSALFAHKADSATYFLLKAIHSYSLSHSRDKDLQFSIKLLAGGMLQMRGEYTESIRLANECIQQYAKATNSERIKRTGDAFALLAKNYLKFKQYKKAKKASLHAIDLYTTLQEWETINRRLLVLGQIYVNLEQIDSAEWVGQKLQKVNPSDYFLLETDISIGTKNYNKALAFCKQGVALATTKRDKFTLGQFQHRLAKLYAILNNNNAAQNSYIAALGSYSFGGRFQNTKYLENRVEAIEVFTDDVLFLTKNSDRFDRKTIEKVIQQADTLIDIMREKDQSTRETKLFWREQVSTIYRAAIFYYHKINEPDKVFYYLEKNRAILLLERLGGGINIVKKELVQKELLSDSTTMVEYVVGDSVGLAVILTKTTMQIVKFDYSQQLILDFLGNVKNPYPNAQIRAQSLALYQQIIAPLIIAPNTKRVIFSPDGLLSAIPFDALLEKDTSDGYLLDKYSISYCYSATSLYSFRATEHTTQHNINVISFAPIDFSQYNLPSLDATKTPLAHLQSQAGSQTYAGRNATLRNFLKVASNAHILELYTHATATDTTKPQIYFAEEVLTLHDLDNSKNIRADLVMLTACNTALGKTVEGEGVMSIAYGFANAGTPATMATLWSVPEISTVNITEAFRANLSANLCKDEALRRAKIAYRNNRAPYYWAAPALFGDATPITVYLVNRYEWTIGMIAVAAFILVLLSFLHKIK